MAINSKERYFSAEEVQSILNSLWYDLLPYITKDHAKTFSQVLLASEKFCSLNNKEFLALFFDPNTQNYYSSFLNDFFSNVVATFTFQPPISEQIKIFNNAPEDRCHCEVILSELLVYIVLVLGDKFTGEVESAWSKYFALLLTCQRK